MADPRYYPNRFSSRWKSRGKHIFTRSSTQRCSVGECFVCNTGCFDRNRFSNSDLPHILEKVIKKFPKGYCVKNPIDFVIKLIKTVPRTVFLVYNRHMKRNFETVNRNC